ncbi:MAG TPA: ATP-binding protein [Candidatus Paceibacterota bacterium]|nr:ATP-binding protein [Candidatus Paceibacterota bacterium]
MNESQVKQIIEKAVQLGSETPDVEFKDARGGFPRETWKTVSAYSHRPSGGYIVFGIKEDRKNNAIEIVGVHRMAELQEKMSDLVSAQMSVVIRPQYFHITLEGNNRASLPCWHKRQ